MTFIITTDLDAGIQPDNSLIIVKGTTADDKFHAICGVSEPWCEQFFAVDEVLVDVAASQGVTCVHCLAVLVAEDELDPGDLARYVEGTRR